MTDTSTAPSGSWLDSFLNTGLGVAKLFTPSPIPTPTKTATPSTTNWTEIALIGGAVLGAVVLLVVLFRK